jgi:hypothetical protein
MHVALRFWRDHAFGQAPAVVLHQAVFPFEEIGDGLRFDADFHAAQAGQQQVHLPHQAGFGALAVRTRQRLFVTEGDHWINTHCAACRNVTRNECSNHQHAHYSRERERIGWMHAEQKTGHEV